MFVSAIILPILSEYTVLSIIMIIFIRSLEIDKHVPIKQAVFNIFTGSLYAI
jgi:hypothetical protein